VNESRLVTKIKKGLEARYGSDVCLFKIHGGPHQKQGIPDLVGCFAGEFFGLEVKLPHRREKVTPLQAHALDTIRKAGGVGAVVTSLQEAVEALNDGHAAQTSR
jgi:hypothetical protein